MQLVPPDIPETKAPEPSLSPMYTYKGSASSNDPSFSITSCKDAVPHLNPEHAEPSQLEQGTPAFQQTQLLEHKCLQLGTLVQDTSCPTIPDSPDRVDNPLRMAG